MCIVCNLQVYCTVHAVFVSVFQVRESEDFYSLSKDKLVELILSDELEIEDEQVSEPPLAGNVWFKSLLL